MCQTVTPHKDFFTAQFLLAFPRGGQYILAIEAAVVDEYSNVWKTGPRSTLTVKVPEEVKLTPISMPGMVGSANVYVSIKIASIMVSESLFSLHSFTIITYIVF